MAVFPPDPGSFSPVFGVSELRSWYGIAANRFLPHPFGIVVTSGAQFGEDVVIGHQVTIGNRGGVMAAPKIGDRVYIGAGAKILGPVCIGNDAVIGANAVVTKDVPSGATVVGANRILSADKQCDSQ